MFIEYLKGKREKSCPNFMFRVETKALNFTLKTVPFWDFHWTINNSRVGKIK